MVVSMGTSSTIEAIVGAASRPVWSQLYMVYSRSFVHDFVERVQAAGVHAIVATIDTASNGPRNRQDRAHFAVPADLGTPHLTPDASQQQTADADFLSRVTWRDLEWLRGIVRLPLWVKGVLDPDDADRAVRAGVSGIIVSNHGGRNLDGAPATIDVLPHIVQRVAGRVPVLMDGGIRRGTDIIKAVALGARAVLVGRPVVYGLSVGGADGVQRVLEILTKELLMGMQLVGLPSLALIDRSVLWSRSP